MQAVCFGTSVEANAPIKVIELVGLIERLELMDRIELVELINLWMWPVQSQVKSVNQT